MRFDTDLPREYGPRLWNSPAFSKRKRITERVRASLENTLYLYSEMARTHARQTDNNPRNFSVKRVSIVGSCAQFNRANSDIDYMLVCQDIDEKSADFLKTMMSYVLFCERDKTEAVDIFIRSEDKYQERASVDITSQVRDLIGRCNYNLLKG